MKLYYFPIAPNPTRVLVYMKEKGIEGVEFVPVDIRNGEQHTPEHLARNPDASLPVLELDDGQFLTESITIIEYLEELFPEPAMIGTDSLSRARVRSLERKVENQLLSPVGRYIHNTNSPVGLPPNPAIAEVEQAKIPLAMARFDALLGDQPFVMGQQPTIVDCTLFATLQFGQFFGLEIPAEYANLRRWYDAFSQRPSTQISL